MYYAIIEKETGIMQNAASNYTDHLDRPLADSLMYVPLNELLTIVLTTDGSELEESLAPIDYTQTRYDFNTNDWVIVYQDNVPEAVDPLQVAEDLKASKLRIANLKLQIPDLSSSARAKLETFITELTNLEINSETAKNDTLWPKPPF